MQVTVGRKIYVLTGRDFGKATLGRAQRDENQTQTMGENRRKLMTELRSELVP